MTPGIPATFGTGIVAAADGEAATEGEDLAAAPWFGAEWLPGRPTSQTAIAATMATPSAGFHSFTPKPPSSAPSRLFDRCPAAVRPVRCDSKRALNRFRHHD